jgi:unsaturated chondroitin disaccharide hydrolase
MKELYSTYPEISNDEIKYALDFCSRQVIKNLPEFTYQFQNAYSENGFYKPIENEDWTTGFWTGEIWLAYEYCSDPALRHAAEVQIDSFLNRINRKIKVDHHDMGFLYSPSCVAGYKLAGSGKGKEAALKAADQLILRR